MEGYEQKLNDSSFAIWIRQNSLFKKGLVTIKVRYLFPLCIDPTEVADMLSVNRYQWDKSLSDRRVLFQDEAKEVSVVHYVMKPPVAILSSRDFAEKQIKFVHEGEQYSYNSFVPEKECPAEGSNVRCETIYAGAVMWKEGDKYVYWSVNQFDFKVMIASHL